MILSIHKSRKSGHPLPAFAKAVFAAYSERMVFKEAFGGSQPEIRLSVEQAEELCKWLNRAIFGIKVSKV